MFEPQLCVRGMTMVEPIAPAVPMVMEYAPVTEATFPEKEKQKRQGQLG